MPVVPEAAFPAHLFSVDSVFVAEVFRLADVEDLEDGDLDFLVDEAPDFPVVHALDLAALGGVDLVPCPVGRLVPCSLDLVPCPGCFFPYPLSSCYFFLMFSN